MFPFISVSQLLVHNFFFKYYEENIPRHFVATFLQLMRTSAHQNLVIAWKGTDFFNQCLGVFDPINLGARVKILSFCMRNHHFSAWGGGSLVISGSNLIFIMQAWTPSRQLSLLGLKIYFYQVSRLVCYYWFGEDTLRTTILR